MKISNEALAEINELARKERELQEEISSWPVKYLTPLLEQRTSVEDVDEVYAQILIKDCENQIKRLPGLMSVDKCFAYMAFSKEEN